MTSMPPATVAKFPSAPALIALLVLLAACARAGLYFVAPNVVVPDSLVYIDSGESLFANGLMSSPKYMPLYPILLHLTGFSGIVWLQIALSSATVYLVYRLTVDLWKDELAGLIAASFCAVHPMLMYYAIARMTETIFTFLLLLGIIFLYRQRILAGSIALVLANLTRPTLDVVLPVLIIAATFVGPLVTPAPRPAFALYLRRLGVFAAVYVILMTPWWLHNYRMYGQFVRLDLGDGVMVVMENSETYERHGGDWSVEPPWEPYSDIKDPVAANKAMRDAGIDYIRRKPVYWLEMSFVRLVRLYTPWPEQLTEHSTSVVSETKLRIITGLAAFPFMIGAVAAVVIYRRRWRRMLLVLIPILFLTAVHSAIQGTVRYRMPIDPLLMALAGGPFAAALRRLVGSDSAEPTGDIGGEQAAA